MAGLHHFKAGAYQFLEGGFPYSAGAIAAPGMRLVRARFDRATTMTEGFERIAQHLLDMGTFDRALCGGAALASAV